MSRTPDAPHPEPVQAHGAGPSTDPTGSFPDPRQFIRDNLRLVAVPSQPEILLYTAHAGSGLRRLVKTGDDDPPPPYWAYQWAGGLVLARHIMARPETVAGRRVLDLGAGGGIVAIAAAKSGARAVIAAEIDGNGRVALGLNAAANGIALAITGDDLTAGPAPAVDIVLVGDLFYDRTLARRVTAFLDNCLAAGIDVLVGDPGRAHLPRSRLHALARYQVPDFGAARDATMLPSAVFAFVPRTAAPVVRRRA